MAIGEANVPVADCDQKHYDSQEKKTYKLNDYIEYWNGLRKLSCGKTLCLYLKVMLNIYTGMYKCNFG